MGSSQNSWLFVVIWIYMNILVELILWLFAEPCWWSLSRTTNASHDRAEPDQWVPCVCQREYNIWTRSLLQNCTNFFKSSHCNPVRTVWNPAWFIVNCRHSWTGPSRSHVTCFCSCPHFYLSLATSPHFWSVLLTPFFSCYSTVFIISWSPCLDPSKCHLHSVYSPLTLAIAFYIFVHYFGFCPLKLWKEL